MSLINFQQEKQNVNTQAIYSSVQGYLREVSRQQLCLYLGKNHFLSRDFDTWTHPEKTMRSASVTLTGYSGSLMLESHFYEKDVAESIKRVSPTAASDYVAEYLNFVAGALRRVLEPNGIQFNRAIPSFDHTSRVDCEKLFRKGESSNHSIWVLTDGKLEVVCVAHLSITKLTPFKAAIPQLAVSLSEKYPTGEVEFFL
jgi:hypothetical protein